MKEVLKTIIQILAFAAFIALTILGYYFFSNSYVKA